jgi:hypothetical protein
VGHGTWGNEFRDYYPERTPMKYTKTSKGRPDNSPKQAVIFNTRGAVKDAYNPRRRQRASRSFRGD